MSSSASDQSATGADTSLAIMEVRAPRPDLFRKTVYVVHSRPREPLTLVQRKLANAWLKFAIEHKPDAKGWWKVPLSRLREDIAFPSNNTTHLKDAARKLMQIVFEWDVLAPEGKRVEWVAQVLFPAVAVSEGYLRFKISDDIYQELPRPEVYALIDMAVMRKFSTAAAMQIWEYCVRFENIGRTSSLPWEEFRDSVLGAADKSSFGQYKVLKSRVLTKAVSEINERSNHEVELIEHKSGKKVESIQFLVRSKGRAAAGSDAQRMLERMKAVGLPGTEAKRLAAKYPAGSLLDALRYTEIRQVDAKQAPLEQPAAYFRKALEQGYGRREDQAPQAAKAGGAKSEKQFDIQAEFEQHRREEARAYFGELSAEEKKALIERYNTQQDLVQLRIKSRITKISEVAFMNWLAQDTWGQPSAQDMLNFSVALLAKVRG
ncbi:replication initiation protein [Azohydromonas lata]|uniref:Replication initiation protein n=1 Tax=Azohydromonas lata TaxID=45677 RepID=A0ABU5IEF5_9BURK|nr:replication initiation protein [Azohydromonas lata]MDZ5456921.1 replication initiation protein [Azohydromonas lata]